MKRDKNRPYRVRTRDGEVSRHGVEDYEYREIDKMLSQPLGTKEFSRLSDGDKRKTWRFVAVIPPEKLELGDQVEYNGQWFEVKRINNWDSIMSAHMVNVT